MNIKIKTSIISNMLKKISGGVKKNEKDSILSHILIKIFKNNIFCAAINEEMEIITHNELNNVFDNGEFIIKYDIINNICKTNKLDSIITLIKKKTSVEIKSNNSTFKINSFSYQTFPSFENDTNILMKLEIETKILKKLLQRSFLAAAENNPRLFLNGILLEINQNIITTLSSNGFRLIFSYILFNNNDNNKNIKIILPKITIKEIINTFNDHGKTHILISNNQIKFITNKLTLTSKLINDIYYNSNIKLPYDNKNIIIKTQELKNAIEKISILCYNNNKITLSFKKKKISINVKNNHEYANITCETNHNTEDAEININYKYLIDIIKTIKHDYLILILTQHNKMLIIKEKYENYIYIIMPLKS